MEELGLLTSAAGGGLFGILGTIGGRVLGIFEAKSRRKDRAQEHAHEIAMQEYKSQERAEMNAHELALHDANRRAVHEEAERAIELTEVQGSFDGLKSSHAAHAALMAHPNGSQWVIDTLRLVRPFLTVLLWFVVSYIFYKTQSAEIAEAAIFAAVAATLWWFGDRPRRKNNIGEHYAK